MEPRIIITLGVYLILARLSLTRLRPPWRQGVFALLNVGALAFLLPWGNGLGFLWCYLGLTLLQYLLLRKTRTSEPAYYGALFLPILLLALVKYVPAPIQSALDRGGLAGEAAFNLYFIGISYMAFRLSMLAIEVRTGSAEGLDLGKYLSFAFFLPTFQIGPISRYRPFEQSLDDPSFSPSPPLHAWTRILVGATKYFLLSGVLELLAHDVLQDDPGSLLVAAIAWYLYLYCNFSGFCDISIGTAALLGIEVEENFDRPLTSRNIRVFWTRWHITLGTYMRIAVFMPLSKALVRRLGPKRLNLCIAISLFVVFVLIGIWHGRGLNYLAFGVIHAVGMVIHFGYELLLKRYLGRDGLKAYQKNRVAQVAAVALTFLFVSVSMVVFAHDTRELLDFFAG